MPFQTPENISGIPILIYLLIVVILGLISLITLALLFKHAEKRTVASSVATAYTIVFVLIVVVSIGTLLAL